MGIFSAAGAWLGRQQAQPDIDNERQQEDAAVHQWDGVAAPKLSDVGAEQMGPSALNGIQTDPRYRQAMLDALDQYGKVAKGGGFTDADRAQIDQANLQAATANRGQQEALMQRAEMQGGLNSGSALAASMQGQQNAATQANARGTQIAIAGRQRALDAYGQAAGIASGARAQDYGEAANKAQAADAIARFNAAGRQQAAYYNSGLQQQRFGNDLTVRGAKAGANNQAAANSGRRAQETIGTMAGQGAIGDGILDAGTQVAGAIAGNPGALQGFGGGNSNPGFSTAPQPVQAAPQLTEDQKRAMGIY